MPRLTEGVERMERKGDQNHTHIVSHLEEVFEAAVHAVVVHGHEERVDDDTQRNEQLHERVEHQ